MWSDARGIRKGAISGTNRGPRRRRDLHPVLGRLAQAADDADQSLRAQRDGPAGAGLPDEEHERLLLQGRRFLRHRHQQERNDKSLMTNPTRALALFLLLAAFGCKTASTHPADVMGAAGSS